MNSFSRAVLLIAAAALCVPGWSQPLDVVKLDKDSFEHQTQAATGQTTGRWCVLLADVESHPALQNSWKALASDEDKPVIYAQVDIVTNPSVAARFNVTDAPKVLLFRDQKMYEYAGGFDEEGFGDRVDAFVKDGWALVGAQEVPSPHSELNLPMNPIYLIALGLCVLLVPIFVKASKAKKQ